MMREKPIERPPAWSWSDAITESIPGMCPKAEKRNALVALSYLVVLVALSSIVL